MPNRSPHRRSPPPPPFITSRHSPSRGRVRSPAQHHLEMSSSSHGRERREYRPRRSRSPIPPPPKERSYTPPLKRKAASPPVRERELSRRTKMSKSPIGSRGGSEHRTYIKGELTNETHKVRNVSSSERFRNEYEEEEREVPTKSLRRGPEGSINFDINELKKFQIEIIRKPVVGGDGPINRSIVSAEGIAPVRRPGVRGIEGQRRQMDTRSSPIPEWREETFSYNNKHEGSRPLFLRPEIARSSKDRTPPGEDYRRIVAIDSTRNSGPERESARSRSRYTPPPYEERRPYYTERARSPYETHHRTPPIKEEYIEPRERHHERRAGSREDLRRDLDVRRREERRYSIERATSYERERESDLRTRIIEKRSEPHLRLEEREHSVRRYENDREKHGRSHHSPPPPPPREKRRAGSLDRHEGPRSSRIEVYDGERKRRGHSREREERGRGERYEHSDHYVESEGRKRPHQYKTEYEPKKFYKHYEGKEFIPVPTRGRGGPPFRRGIAPYMRGRGMIRGVARGGFRGAPMGGIRGVPRVPFMRGFPPRKSAF